MKKTLIIFIFLLCNITNPAWCNTVYLEPNKVYFLDVPQPKYEIAEEANETTNTDIWENEDNLELYSEDDFAQNKFEKNLCRFINKRIRNKKLNLFSTPIGGTSSPHSL